MASIEIFPKVQKPEREIDLLKKTGNLNRQYVTLKLVYEWHDCDGRQQRGPSLPHLRPGLWAG